MSIVERFLRWAQTAPVARRAEAADALARSFLLSPLTPERRDDVEAAMTVLLDDPAAEVREALARVLAPSEQAPHHLILTLARDRADIAAIVAEQSPLILDSELVDLLAGRDETVQIAIAGRPFLSRSVSAALAEVGTAEACRALVCNDGARVPRFSLDRMIERHGDDPKLRLTLLERDDLPVEVRQVLLERLTGSLRALVVGNEWLSPERADAVTRDARECATIAFAFDVSVGDMPALIARLIEARELTPAFLMRAAVSGQSALFEAALAALTRLPHGRVRALVASGRASSLRALLQKAGLPAKTFPAFQAAIDVLRDGEPAVGAQSDYRRATQLIDAIVARYQRRPDREMDQILALLHRFAADAKRSAARGHTQTLLQAA